jgi:hypothetical protein
MRLDQIDQLPITRKYIQRLKEATGTGSYLVPVFVEFNKLTGVPATDRMNVRIMQHYSERAVLSEAEVEVKSPILQKPQEQPEQDFDPFAHLRQRQTDVDDDTVPDAPIDEKNDCVLQLQDENAKLENLHVVFISLPAGYTCPFADKCKTFASRTGKPFPKQPGQTKAMQLRQPNVPQEFQPGFPKPKDTKYDPSGQQDLDYMRCFAASDEARKPNVRNLRWRNYDLVRMFNGDMPGMVNLLLRSLAFYEQTNKKIRIFRIHEAGDFYSQEYLDAWLETAKQRPDILFYAYTTSLPYWIERKEQVDAIQNFRLIASHGSKRQDLADKHNLRQAIVVLDDGEAIRRKLKIDVNEFLAIFDDKDFALLVHNTGPAGTAAAKANRRNEQLVKKMAKQHNLPAKELDALIRKYTTKAIEIHDQDKSIS